MLGESVVVEHLQTLVTTEREIVITAITPYLFFSGRCEEALEFYRQALGAQVEMVMRFNESPDPTPPGMLQVGFENKVMHSSFTVNGIRLMASDGCDDKSTLHGFQLALNVDTEATAHKMFNALAEGGNVQMPLTKTFWSPCFGMVADKFNVVWMVMVPGDNP
jgi:PhnB protein